MIHSDSTEREGSARGASDYACVNDALARHLGSVPQVKFVMTEAVPNALLVWIAVDNPEPGVRRRIYDQELGLLSEFPETDFDFNLIVAMGRPAAEIAAGSKLIYSRPE
jgi:hypothetical protein